MKRIDVDINHTLLPGEKKNLKELTLTTDQNTKDIEDLKAVKIVADGEDLEIVGGKLKFADKKYSPSEHSGLGRVYLRKNAATGELTEKGITYDSGEWGKLVDPDTIFGEQAIEAELTVNGEKISSGYAVSLTKYKGQDTVKSVGIGIFNREITYDDADFALRGWFNDSYKPFVAAKDYNSIVVRVQKAGQGEMNISDVVTFSIKTKGGNILTQNMITKANTIYIIQYDYDLNGETITVPENCVLKFEGGSFANGTLVCNQTEISSTRSNSYAKNLAIKGVYSTPSPVAMTGSYKDLVDKPVIPSSYEELDDLPDIPTKTSDLTNDSNFITKLEADGVYVTTEKLEEDYYSKDDVSTVLPSFVDRVIEGKEFLTKNDMLEDVYTKQQVDDIIPSKTSDLTNNSGFVTAVDIQQDYYTKSEISDLIPTKVSELRNDAGYLDASMTYTKQQVDSLIPTKTSELINDRSYVTNSTLENGYYNKDEVNGLVPTKLSDLRNDSHFLEPADLSSYYTKAEIDKQQQATVVLTAKNIDNVRSTTGWKTLLSADDSTLLWDNTTTDPVAGIFLDKNASFGTVGLQINLWVNGEQVDTNKISVAFYKWKNNSIVKQVGFQIFFKDIAKTVSSFFNNDYVSWVNYSNFDKIWILVENVDDSDPGITGGDSVKIVIKTCGAQMAESYGYVVEESILSNPTEKSTLFTMSDGSSFKLGVKDNDTGQVYYVSGIVETSPYTLTEGDYSALKGLLQSGSKQVVVIPVSENSSIDQSAKLTITNKV